MMPMAVALLAMASGTTLDWLCSVGGERSDGVRLQALDHFVARGESAECSCLLGVGPLWPDNLANQAGKENNHGHID